MRNKPRKKINPQLVADQNVKEELHRINENFVEIFSRLDAVRWVRGVEVGLSGISLSTSGTRSSPAQFRVSLPVSGKKPVQVCLAANVAPFNTGGQTAGGFHIYNTTAVTPAIVSTFYLLADEVSFWGTVKGVQGQPLTAGNELHYYGSPSEILGIHYPTNPGIVQYSLQFDNFLINQTTEFTGVHLFATEIG